MSRRLFACLLVTLAFAAGGSAQPAPGTVSVTTFVIRGHGWGHGVGMAQWGAYGFAVHGLSYDKILAHYYPGTTLAQAPVKIVRVLLGEGLKSVTISSTKPFRLKDGTGAIQKLPAGSVTVGPSLVLGSGQGLPGPLQFLPGGAPLSTGHAY